MRLTRPREEFLDDLQRDTFNYFLRQTNPLNGLVADNTRRDSHASIAVTGFALGSLPAAVERGFVARHAALSLALTTLRFFWNAPQTEAPDATGHRGFYYHFLDLRTGQRRWRCELSTIDTAFLLAGALSVAVYFDRETGEERELRTLSEALYLRADWLWAANGGAALTHGWKPERGFLRYRWEGYNEALLLYALALGSPTHALTAASYAAWMRTYVWKKIYGYEYLYAGPLFVHQLSHLWIDFRGIRDEFMRHANSDYHENSRRATYVQREYALRKPRKLVGYDSNCWGLTASEGPRIVVKKNGELYHNRRTYLARGVPFGPDDGTISPWAVAASLPFAPEIVYPLLEYTSAIYPQTTSDEGYKGSFNPTSNAAVKRGDSSAHPDDSSYYGLDQGAIFMMVENYRSGMPWQLLRRCKYLVAGLHRAGFAGGWLD